MFEEIKQKEFHDPEWLSREEQKLRAHIRQNPIGSESAGPKMPLPLAIAAALIVAGAILMASRKAPPENTPVTTPTYFVSETPVVSESPTPLPSTTPTPTPTPIPTTYSSETPVPSTLYP